MTVGQIDRAVARSTGFDTRAEIGLIPPESISTSIDPDGVVFHYGGRSAPTTDHRSCLAVWRSWQAYHMGPRYTPPRPGHGWVDVAYTVGVCQHGRLLAGRGEGIRTAANGSSSANRSFYAAVWIGGELQIPTQAALDGLLDAALDLRRSGAGDRLLGHSDVRSTGCPGDTVLRLARAFDRRPIPTFDDLTEETEMRRLAHVGERGGTAYELVTDPADPSGYALKPVPGPSAARILTGSDEWSRETVVIPADEAKRYRLLG